MTGPRLLDRSSALPLWAQLEQDLRRRAEAGELAGDFPGELELAGGYGVSRNTVREAMRRLRADGTVVAERGRRPRLNLEIRQPLDSPYSLYDSIAAAGAGQRSEVRARAVAVDPEAATRLRLPPDEPLVHVERLRLADEEPLALDWIWLPHDVGVPLLRADLARHGFYEELEERTGIRLTGGSEHIRAVVPDLAERRLLGLARNAAAFAIERLGLAGDRPIEWRRTLIRGDRFSVVADFRTPGPSRAGRDLLAAAAPYREPSAADGTPGRGPSR